MLDWLPWCAKWKQFVFFHYEMALDTYCKNIVLKIKLPWS